MFFMSCPKCGFEPERGALECPRCGIIFSKATRSDDLPVPRRPLVHDEERVEDGRIGPREWRILAFGLGAAIFLYWFPLTRYILSLIVTLFHELGHAIAGWLMGYPSIPAFDFVYGGGLTTHGPFSRSIAIAIAVIFAYLMYLFRENRKSIAIVGVIFAVWLFFITREWRRELVFASAGHAGELILAGIFFYKALSGNGWRIPELERPLGAFVAFFVQIHTTLFAWRLLKDPEFFAWYRDGKGGALMNDLEVIALNLQIWLGIDLGIEGAARGLLVFSVVPTIVALIWYFERARWHRVLRALRTAES
jgi:hypothetical protein